MSLWAKYFENGSVLFRIIIRFWIITRNFPFPASKTDFERIVISLAGNESGLFSVKAVLSYLLARVIIRETVLRTDLEKFPQNYH